VQFPTWTIYGGQDDLDYSWPTSSFCAGTNLGNGTWKYHVSASNHNNEAGQYETDIYIYGKKHSAFAIGIPQFLKTDDYAGSLYLTETESNFNNDKAYYAGVNGLMTNFTYEFDAKPTTTTTIYNNGAWALDGEHNFIIYEPNTGDNTTNAGIGLTLGTNGASAIAHAGGYYYALLNYNGDLSSQHRYRFTVKNNVPYLYIDGTLIASGIEPVSNIITLATYSTIGTGSYGSYKGWANNFVIYNTARQ
jgi:ricin B lectin